MGTQFTVETMTEAMTKTLNNYKDKGIIASVSQNGHMNSYKDTPNSIVFIKDEFKVAVCEKMLEEFIADTVPKLKLETPTTGDIVMGFANNCSFVHTYADKLHKDVREAVIIDFVNYVGVCCGMDLAMYASDI